MRVIAGTARRIALVVADDSTSRPFLEKARGALFNSLAPRLAETRALDLFAGSGALGIEALSRGAATCAFIERDPKAIRALTDNLERCHLSNRARILRQDASAVGLLRETFDLVFVDPPFPLAAEWLDRPAQATPVLGAIERMEEGGVLVFRYEDKRKDPPVWSGLELLREKRYGRSRVCLYEKRGAHDAREGAA